MIPLLPEALGGFGRSGTLLVPHAPLSPACCASHTHYQFLSLGRVVAERRRGRGGGGDAGALSLMGNFENMSGRRVKWVQSLGA